ncbi:MAG: AP2 domain-containing protein [Nitrospirae bacterium]|nr:AP2 domain-containing protein [Nitrospirota bacterium]
MEKPKLLKDLGFYYPLPTSNKKRHFGLYLCYCGKGFITQITSVNCGETKSCGCYHIQRTKEANTKHGIADTPLHNLWKSMKGRCYCINDESYINYGGRGITVCDEWKNDSSAFIKWALKNDYINRHNGRSKIDINRINNDGNYEPGNCEFTDRSTNCQNRRLLFKNNTSGYRGVSYNKKTQSWMAYITFYFKRYYLGLFPTPELAAQAYNDFIIKHKSFHPLNIIPKPLDCL